VANGPAFAPDASLCRSRVRQVPRRSQHHSSRFAMTISFCLLRFPFIFGLPVLTAWCIEVVKPSSPTSGRRRPQANPRNSAEDHGELENCVANVRFGSLADIMARSRRVRFIPDSGHSSVQARCPKSAISGHLQMQGAGTLASGSKTDRSTSPESAWCRSGHLASRSTARPVTLVATDG
jgi:hypothetical protein